MAYCAVPLPTKAYLEPIGVDDVMPDMPLFLYEDKYVSVPLERAYLEAYRGMPSFWREVLEGRRPFP